MCTAARSHSQAQRPMPSSGSQRPMRSKPQYGWSAFGIAIEPSACWWFSSTRSALGDRDGGAVQHVHELVFPPLDPAAFAPSRESGAESARLVVGAVRGARHFAQPPASPRPPSRPRCRTCDTRARRDRPRDVEHAIGHVERLERSAPRCDQVFEHRAESSGRVTANISTLVNCARGRGPCSRAVRAGFGAEAVRDAGELARQIAFGEHCVEKSRRA